jgi:hypothetical protein
MQMTMGVDFAEQEWLNEEVTKHIFSGKLRVFSFFSDAGQFGANQGYTGVVFFNLCNVKVKYYLSSFHLCRSLGIYGMVISGTRGH